MRPDEKNNRISSESEHHYKWGQICFKKKSEGEESQKPEFTGERAINWWGGQRGGALMDNGVTTGQEKISDQWACWGLSFLFRSIYSVETKMGQTFMIWLILQHFLVHFCYFEAFTGRQAEPSQRRVRHTVRTEHTSPNQAWTLLQHTCGKPHTTGGHTQWTGEGYNTSQ